jgi:hypothetical protein
MGRDPASGAPITFARQFRDRSAGRSERADPPQRSGVEWVPSATTTRAQQGSAAAPAVTGERGPSRTQLGERAPPQGGGHAEEEVEPIAAGSMFMILPVLIFYILFQRQFIQGMTAGAVRG